MTRTEFVKQIAYEYVLFKLQNEGRKIQPLDRSFAFNIGRQYIETGAYKPRKSCLDYTIVARECRKHINSIETLVREQGDHL